MEKRHGEHIQEHEHDSFGMISISKVNSSGNQTIFGSDIKVRDYYQLEIKRAKLERDITDDKYWGVGQPIITLNLTERQLNELLLNRNCGEGIPCSIHYTETQGYIKDRPKLPTRKEALTELFSARLKDFHRSLEINSKEIKEVLGKNKLSKADKELIENTIYKVEQELTRNLPYITGTYLETLENVEAEAKSQILGLVQRLKEEGNLPAGSKSAIKKLMK